MNYKQLLEKYKTDKTRVFINGMPNSDEKGTILAVNDDYIEFEIRKEEKEKNTGKERTSVSVLNIQLCNITEINTGIKKSDKNALEIATTEDADETEEAKA